MERIGTRQWLNQSPVKKHGDGDGDERGWWRLKELKEAANRDWPGASWHVGLLVRAFS